MPDQTTTPEKQVAIIESVMIRIKGKPFYCHCKCNVFHHPDPKDTTIYECNACGEWYRGD